MTTALIVIAICIVVFLLLAIFAPKSIEFFIDVLPDIIESIFDD